MARVLGILVKNVQRTILILHLIILVVLQAVTVIQNHARYLVHRTNVQTQTQQDVQATHVHHLVAVLVRRVTMWRILTVRVQATAKLNLVAQQILRLVIRLWHR